MPDVSVAHKLITVLRYLELGGEWKYQGYTIVWSEAGTLFDGTKYGIQGLAIKGERIVGNTSMPHYMGASFDFNAVAQMIDEIPLGDYLGMVASVALKEGLVKRRRGKE